MPSSTNANGVTFTTGGGDGTTGTLTVTFDAATQASISGAPGLVGGTDVEFLTGGSAGTIAGLLGTVDYVVGPGVSESFSTGLLSLGETSNFYVGGTLDLTGSTIGALSGTNVYVYGGTLTSDSAAVVSALSGSTITVLDGGVVNGTGNNLLSALTGATIAFGAHGGTIAADATSSGAVINLLSGLTVTGFNSGADKIDFTNATSNTVDSYTISSSGGNSTMSFYSGTGGHGTLLGEATVQTTSQLTDGTFSVGQSGPLTITQDTVGTGFTVGAATSTLVCYVTGTRIVTTRGDVAVEDLTVGDLAVTALGAARPITWIGQKRIEAPSREQWPVRVLAGAFGEGLPRRDLFLSPGHAVCVSVMDEVFAPIDHLINGATIAQVEVPEVTYWHVELESHDVLLAEGLPAESYMDCGNRAWFGREHGRLQAVDAERDPTANYARPFVDRGPVVDAIRQRLTARAEFLGWTRTADMDLHLLVDGRRFEPEIDGDLARFIFPAEAKTAALVSKTFVPAGRSPSGDRRTLGVRLDALRISDGMRLSRDVPLQSLDGVHPEEAAARQPWRWTNGRLELPAELWAGANSQVFLTLTHKPQAAWAWVAPQVPLAANMVRAA